MRLGYLIELIERFNIHNYHSTVNRKPLLNIQIPRVSKSIGNTSKSLQQDITIEHYAKCFLTSPNCNDDGRYFFFSMQFIVLAQREVAYFQLDFTEEPQGREDSKPEPPVLKVACPGQRYTVPNKAWYFSVIALRRLRDD